MTMTVGARSLDNEERSNFRDYMSLLSLSVDASMTMREVMAVAYLIGRHDALRDVRNASSPARTVKVVELVILLFVVLAVACFGLLLPFLRLAVGIVLLAVRLLASLARSMGAGR